MNLNNIYAYKELLTTPAVRENVALVEKLIKLLEKELDKETTNG